MPSNTGPRIEMIRVGAWEVYGLVDRRFALDGGWMFGIVPRVMWEKLLPPDAENRVPMQSNIYVIKTGDANVLLDAGIGDCLSDMDSRIYSPRGQALTESSLQSIGLSTSDITHLVFTHLHTDHANGAFSGDPEHPTPRYRNAQYYVQRDEWDDAMHPDDRSRSVYPQKRLQILEDSGRLNLLDGSVEILPGIGVNKTGGHTRGHQAVYVENGGDRFLFYADIIPSHFHVKSAYVAAVDLYPVDTMRVKRELLADASDDRTTLGLCHDIDYIFAKLLKKEKWTEVVPAESEALAVS